MKRFAKSKKLTNARCGGLSSYGFTLVTLAFLQSEGILPTLYGGRAGWEAAAKRLAQLGSTKVMGARDTPEACPFLEAQEIVKMAEAGNYIFMLGRGCRRGRAGILDSPAHVPACIADQIIDTGQWRIIDMNTNEREMKTYPQSQKIIWISEVGKCVGV